MYEKEKKHWYYQVTFIFVFRPKMNVHFRFRFVFGRKWNFIFVGIFVYGRKWKMLFGRPLYITKRSWSWSWDAKSWSWTLGMVLVLILKKKSWLNHWYTVGIFQISNLLGTPDHKTQTWSLKKHFKNIKTWDKRCHHDQKAETFSCGRLLGTSARWYSIFTYLLT